MVDDEGFDIEDDGEIEIDFDFPGDRRMIILKVLGNGDIHAETNDGEMMIFERETSSVKSFLDGDTKWVHGQLDGQDFSTEAWDVMGFYLGFSNGKNMERARSGIATH